MNRTILFFASFSFLTLPFLTVAIHPAKAEVPQRCHSNQLSVRPVSSSAGAGNRAVNYAFTNTSSSTCALKGYPGLELLNAKNQPIKGIQINWTQSTYFYSAKPQLVTLAPGAQAYFQAAFNRIPAGQSCTTSSKLKITPPNAYRSLTLNDQLTVCGGRINLTPVQRGMIQGY